MRKSLLVTLSVFLALPVLAQQLRLPRPSQKSVVTQTVGLTDITITYSRPGVKGRKIFGGLVPYGKVWRTGANETTSIAFSDDVSINGQPLAKGTYGIHTSPNENEWTLIFSKAVEPSGLTYDEKNDALRVTVKPRASAVKREWMTFEFPQISTDSATIVLGWDMLEVPFTVDAHTTQHVMSSAAVAIAAAPADDFNTALRAATFAFDNGFTSDATKWLDQSLKVKETMSNTWLKARMQAAAGNKAEAVKTAEHALALKTDKDSKDLADEIARTAEGWKK